MSDSYSQLKYFAREFQALPPIALAVFGAMVYPFASFMLVHFLEI